VFVGFESTDDIVALILDSHNFFVAVVRGIENDGQSRSSRQLERRNDILDGDLGLFCGSSKSGARSSGTYIRAR
jgi:hypothetical protein